MKIAVKFTLHFIPNVECKLRFSCFQLTLIVSNLRQIFKEIYFFYILSNINNGTVRRITAAPDVLVYCLFLIL